MISSSQAVTLRGHAFAIDTLLVPTESLAISLVLSLPSGPAKAWRGTFSSQYIEEVTKKTGNFKRFAVFAEMLLSSLDASNPAVSLDLISSADLGGSSSMQDTKDVTMHERVYLVLTYAAAFDRCVFVAPPACLRVILTQFKSRVHYPLPLQLVHQKLNEYPSVPSQIYPHHHASYRAPSPPIPAPPPPPPQHHTSPHLQQLHHDHHHLTLLETQLRDLKHTQLTHLEEIARLLKENDKLKHIVKHYKSQQKPVEEETMFTMDRMPELFQTAFRGISSGVAGWSGVEASGVRKNVRTLQRLVGKLLEGVGEERVRS
ncbi:hypothetical protein HDU98_006921 [Podochytrium sp. JEL0797]|nr:hypothetical protein HDU98_006921 [Podochytrium sp. JEL0797]